MPNNAGNTLVMTASTHIPFEGSGPNRRMPNFFLIGPPKAGTTAVFEKLSQHSEIFMSNPKEPNFFVYQGGNPYGWDPLGKDNLEWYLSLFDNAGAYKVLGDASPYYLCCHHCAREIHQFNPHARIITILRNPVYRAFSMYRYWHWNSPHRISQSDFVDSFHGDTLAKSFEKNRKHRIGWLKDIGCYAKHLRKYLELFPSTQIKAVFYHDLVRDPRSFYRSIQRYLSVTSNDEFAREELGDLKVNVTIERRWKGVHTLLNRGYHGDIADRLKRSMMGGIMRRLRTTVNDTNVKPKSQELEFPRDRYGELISIYSDDITMLEDMLGVDLEGWRTGTML